MATCLCLFALLNFVHNFEKKNKTLSLQNNTDWSFFVVLLLLFFRYVTYARTEEEHNLVVFQFFRHIYYKVTQQITKGTELKVWIGRDYATLLGLAMGKFTYGWMQ